MGKFFGTYERNLDAKNRLLLPSKMMGEMPLRLYLLRGFEGSLSLYPEEAFNAYIEELQKLSYLDSKARSYVRLAAGSVVPLDVDSHNRITIPAEIKARYKLGEEIVILGALDHMEIFDKVAYTKYLSEEENRYEEIADSLAHLGEKDGNAL